MQAQTLSDSIQAHIESLLERPPEAAAWAISAIRQHRFLPLYWGWTATLCIRPDGTVVGWKHEEGIDAVEEITHPYLHRFAIMQGSKQYPELGQLIPEAPDDSEVCPDCMGSGNFRGIESKIICGCGGLGWIIPGEDRGLSPG